jgi:hypothetical protein
MLKPHDSNKIKSNTQRPNGYMKVRPCRLGRRETAARASLLSRVTSALMFLPRTVSGAIQAVEF